MQIDESYHPLIPSIYLSIYLSICIYFFVHSDFWFWFQYVVLYHMLAKKKNKKKKQWSGFVDFFAF